jgi:hypothetical protein
MRACVNDPDIVGHNPCNRCEKRWCRVAGRIAHRCNRNRGRSSGTGMPSWIATSRWPRTQRGSGWRSGDRRLKTGLPPPLQIARFPDCGHRPFRERTVRGCGGSGSHRAGPRRPTRRTWPSPGRCSDRGSGSRAGSCLRGQGVSSGPGSEAWSSGLHAEITIDPPMGSLVALPAAGVGVPVSTNGLAELGFASKVAISVSGLPQIDGGAVMQSWPGVKP